MAILLKNGSLFFHVPKTGGTWVTEVLRKAGCVVGQLGFKHSFPAELGCSPRALLHPSQLRDRYRLKYGVNSPISGFCFLRDPLTWYKSWYFYQVRRGWIRFGSSSWDDPHPLSCLNSVADYAPNSFEQFLDIVCEEKHQFLSLMYLKYLDRNYAVALDYNNLVNETKALLVDVCELAEECAETLLDFPRKNESNSESLILSTSQMEMIKRNESIYFNHSGLFRSGLGVSH